MSKQKLVKHKADICEKQKKLHRDQPLEHFSLKLLQACGKLNQT